MRYEFTIADVFTSSAFGGNQLAVLPHAGGLSARAMQQVAREFNFAETAFVLPPDDPTHAGRVRIFTPRAEVPFAGHPTIGTAAVLVHRSLVPCVAGVARLVLEEQGGPIVVSVDRRDGALTSCLTLERRAERPDTRLPAEALASVLSLPVATIIDSWFASVGLPFCFILLDSDASVDRAVLDRGAWNTWVSGAWSSNVFIFAGNGNAGASLYARMFAPAYGIEEDPATGSACAALASTLADALPQREGTFGWFIKQGVAMGRPSEIHVRADKHRGQVVRVHLTGATTIVGEGTIAVPD